MNLVMQCGPRRIKNAKTTSRQRKALCASQTDATHDTGQLQI
jgi:hypothetical protein